MSRIIFCNSALDKYLKIDFILIRQDFLRLSRGYIMDLQEIASLEEKIDALISLVIQLKNEKEALLNKLKEKEEENIKLLEEINRREEERRIIKERIGSLIEKLSQI